MKKLNVPLDHPVYQDRTCKTCGILKHYYEFGYQRNKGCYAGYQAHTSCKICTRKRKFETHLLRMYNLTLEEYEQMEEDQDGKCYLCGNEPTDIFQKLVVDHCHKTGEVRKLLCRGCNIHLAKYEACEDYFNKVSKYLGYT